MEIKIEFYLPTRHETKQIFISGSDIYPIINNVSLSKGKERVFTHRSQTTINVEYCENKFLVHAKKTECSQSAITCLK